MKLNELLDGVALTARHVQDVECSGICCDTRDMTPGCLFVALPGYKTDGHRYIRQALEGGAAAVLCQRPPEGEGPWLVTEDTRAALAIASANWFGHPARELTLLAVTGTNGKTTTTYLLKAMLEGCLHTKVGLIGTNQNLIGEESLPAHRTTPESYEVQELLREMADAGCTHVVMEASSHALVLHRLDGIPFRAGIFTNLTQDHLDFHGTMEAYRDAKGLLFRQCAAAVLNLDDEAGRYYAETVPVPTFTYSECRDEADLTAKNLRLFPQRVEFEAVTRDAISRVRLPIPGGFTIYNALGVLACGLVLGLPLGVLLVAGDKTHPPGRVICLFGCGGDRDRTKRPRMGAVAGALADVAVVTSDNPRTEVPMDIINDILPGLEGAPAEVVVEPDRRAAIRRALSLARAGDTVVLAGKGHETYQEVDGVEYHLDEREEIAAYFA